MRAHTHTDLEAGGAPVDELDGALGLDLGDGLGAVLGNNVAAVQQAARHVLAVAGVALDHLRKENREGPKARYLDFCGHFRKGQLRRALACERRARNSLFLW